MHKTQNFTLSGKDIIKLSTFDTSRVSILFTYFDVIKSFIGIFDNLSISNKFVILPIKFIAIIFVLSLNYVFIAYKAFMKVFVFIILINDSRKKILNDNKSDIVVSIKRWY